MRHKVKPPIEILQHRVEGTSRQRIRSAGGTVLDRMSIYMKSESWELVEEMAQKQSVSMSVVIARLVWNATKDKRIRRQVSE